MSPSEFVESISALTFQDVFNPYANRCPIYDFENAPATRRRTLLSMLTVAARCEVDAIWIGRDLGFRGGRRTGLALTDDEHLEAFATRWNIMTDRPTHGPAIKERTASIVWQVLARIENPVVLWNVFPLHPHEPGDPFTNRAHNAHERRAGEVLLANLTSMLKPKRIVAIGNDAAAVSRRLFGERETTKVRHPSYGGQIEFIRQIRALYLV